MRLRIVVVVVVTLGILGWLVFHLGSVRTGITDTEIISACRTDITALTVAVEAYAQTFGSDPADLETLTTGPRPFLRPAPRMVGSSYTESGYTITYDPATGTVSSSPDPCP